MSVCGGFRGHWDLRGRASGGISRVPVVNFRFHLLAGVAKR
jgi:hypothetical protein